jgi:4,5-DOPA dioxygenase extradiol
VNELILSNNFEPLLDYHKLGKALQLAVPTPDHYYPLIYILGLKQTSEKTSLFNDKLMAGSLSMTSVKFDS